MSARDMVRMTCDDRSFNEFLRLRAAVTGKDLMQMFKDELRLLSAELIKLTPPFSGRAITRMAAKRGATINDNDIGPLSALAVGKRRVEKDIRKVIYGLNGASLSGPQIASHDNPANKTDWGVLQKCEGKQAVRVFATKKGEVYGADLTEWDPKATIQSLTQHHNANRTKRGRVTYAGQRTRNIGRWKWLDVKVVKERMLKRFINKKKRAVGQAKGGWAGYLLALKEISGRGWFGKFASTSSVVKDNSTDNHFSVTLINRSRWATAGDPDRVMKRAFQGRAKRLAKDIREYMGNLDKRWGKMR